jgi:hypothetical protein
MLVYSGAAGMSVGFLAVIVFMNVVATIWLWRSAARRPEIRRKMFLNDLWRSEPITPKHTPPQPLEAGSWGVGEEELQFFADFEDFANVVNRWLADEDIDLHNPWRLQELPDADLLELGGDDGPTYGRSYAVFHNQIRIGKIEIRPHSKYTTQNPGVAVHVGLDWIRLLSFGRVRGFLEDIARHTTESCPRTLEWLWTNHQIDVAMMSILWETQEVSQYGDHDHPGHGHFEVRWDGLATYYYPGHGHFKVRWDGLATYYLDRAGIRKEVAPK